MSTPTLPGLYFLTYTHGDGSRGWLKLAEIHRDHDLAELENPYAAGLIDVPDSMGYTLAAITNDGDTLCERCVIDPTNPVHPDRFATESDGWGVVAWTHSGELDGPDHCGHCGREWTGHDE